MSDDDHDDSQKTEDATPKKLEEARKKGQVPISKEVTNWLMLTAGTIVILAMGPDVMQQIMYTLRTYIEQSANLPPSPGGMQYVIVGAVMEIMKILTLPFLFLMAVAIGGTMVQIGPIFSAESIQMDISKISPMKGFSRLFSMRSLMEFLKGLLKITIISAVGYVILAPFFNASEHFVGLPIPLVMDEMKILVSKLLIGLMTILFMIALADLVYQRYEFSKKMRMTKQEIKDEYRQSEGDPHVKAKLRQLRQEKARKRMMQAVPGADVIITNPTHYSIALKYDPDKTDAPIVVAKGIDEFAMRIREVAKEHDVMIMPNPPLARVLFDTVEVDEMVPPQHFKAVAEVISYVFRMKGKLK